MKNLLNTQRGVKLINKFSTIKVLVVGDVMIDQFIWGRVKRISPEAPVPVVSVTSESFRLGGAANVVSNIYSLGGKPHICGVIGNDDMGKKILEMLDVLGIEIDDEIVVEPNRITTVKTRIIAHNQQVVRIDREVVKTIDESTREFLVTYILGHINELDGLIISDYEKGVISESILPEILTRAKESGRIVTVDPRSNNFDAYKFVTAITPNHIEAGHSVGFEIVDEASLSRAGKILLNKLECNCVLITRGDEGMSLFEKNGKQTHIPTLAKEVYDVTGAGDTVISAFTMALCAGANFKEAAMIANYAAGIVVGEVGTATTTQDKLIESVKKGY